MARKHGLSKTKEIQAWVDMKQRCYNVSNQSYKHYGGRGIKVCDRWRHSFENFIADLGFAPSKGHSLERIDVDKDYEPSNCRWATRAEQMRNKRNNRWFSHNGKRQLMSDWAKELNVPLPTLWDRVNKYGFESVVKKYIHPLKQLQ